jgi:2'-5' RNA ligase
VLKLVLLIFLSLMDPQVLALVILLPGRPEIAAVRQEHDRAWPRWPEHITLVHPLSSDAAATLRALVSPSSLSLSRITLDRIDAFCVSKATATKPGCMSFHLRADATSETQLIAWHKAYGMEPARRPFCPHLTLAQCSIADAPAMRSTLEAWLSQHGPFTWDNISHASILARPAATNNPAAPFVEHERLAL